MPERPNSFLHADTLRQLREQTDWRALFQALGLQADPKRSKEHDWWCRSPLSDESTPSFHVNAKGWYCFSTQQGGGIIELVQAVVGHQTGKTLNCYEAGHWLIEQGLADAAPSPAPASPNQPLSQSPPLPEPARGEEEKNGEEPRENLPIRQSLLSRLQMDHPLLQQRGLSRATCEYLGCGYLEGSRSPLNERVVFQVRGVRKGKRVILSHIGRATRQEQIEEAGKWKFYGGFNKRLELYNLDQALLDPEAREQAQAVGHWLVVEGCFDLAKLVESGIRNGVATFGAHLTEEQVGRLRELAKASGVRRFRFVYDRDEAGRHGQEAALTRLAPEEALQAEAFDWEQGFVSPRRGMVRIPGEIGDVAEFSVEQLQWLRRNKYL